MEDVSVEAYIPFGVAIESVKLAKGRILSPVAPSELPILQRNFVELAGMKSVSEPVDPISVDVAFVFIPSSSDLVEVP